MRACAIIGWVRQFLVRRSRPRAIGGYSYKSLGLNSGKNIAVQKYGGALKPQVLRDKSISRIRARLPGRFCRGASREKWRDAINRN